MSIKTIKGLPLFEAKMTDAGCGVLRVSLVDAPAVESDFVSYGENQRPKLYEVTDEEKRRVFGVVLRADYPIYRADENGEYYIIFRPDDIRAFAQKYLADGLQNEVDLNHDFKSIEGAQMVQYFIKDTEGGIAPAGFDEIADGSLFAEYQITDEDLWQRIKDGEFKGFSVEIIHAEVPAEYKKINPKTRTNMSKIEKLKAALAKGFAAIEAEVAASLATFGSLATDKGTVIWDGEEELKVGDAVHAEDADGNTVALEDGDYKTEDGKVIVIAEGKVSEIKDAETEPAEPAEPSADEQKKAEFSAKVAKYSASYDEKRKKIAAAILAKIGFADYWIYDAGDDFAVIEYWNGSSYAYRRYAIGWEGEEAIVTDGGVDGHIGFIPDNEPEPAAPTEPAEPAEPATSEEDLAQVKSDYEAQLAAKDAEITALKAKLDTTPAGVPAHEAYKKADKQPAENFIETYKRYRR